MIPELKTNGKNKHLRKIKGVKNNIQTTTLTHFHPHNRSLKAVVKNLLFSPKTKNQTTIQYLSVKIEAKGRN